jgi:hypothetical protein
MTLLRQAKVFKAADHLPDFLIPPAKSAPRAPRRNDALGAYCHPDQVLIVVRANRVRDPA